MLYYVHIPISSGYQSNETLTADTRFNELVIVRFNIGRNPTTSNYLNYGTWSLNKVDALIKDIKELRKLFLKSLAALTWGGDYPKASFRFPVPQEARREIKRGYSQVPRRPCYRATRNR